MRVTLKTFLVFIAAVSVASAIVDHRARSQMQAIATIKESGGVSYGPDQVALDVGYLNNTYRSVEFVELPCRSLDPDLILSLKKCQALRRIKLLDMHNYDAEFQDEMKEMRRLLPHVEIESDLETLMSLIQ